MLACLEKGPNKIKFTSPLKTYDLIEILTSVTRPCDEKVFTDVTGQEGNVVAQDHKRLNKVSYRNLRLGTYQLPNLEGTTAFRVE